MTADNSTNNNGFFFASDLKILCLGQERKIFSVTICLETKNCGSKISLEDKKLWKQNFGGSLTLTIIPRKAKFIVGYTNFKPQC